MSSNPVHVGGIFDEAIRRSPGSGRDAYLEEACGDDASLRQRVDRLLSAADAAGSFLESPAEDPPATVALSVTEQPGDTIGCYKLMQQIGEGGMGVVYMAEQTEPIERRVALKIIKPGMDSRQVIARFEAERQALAMMDHPNIARALEAGMTDTGRPYFVMELVKGVPITEYCDEHHLATRERLKLFVPVCQAIQHAHQKGIIHRDIKPSNVLVAHYDDQPVPKVIDFGVAKAIDQRLTEKTMFTEFGQVLGTFEYMSPEQARFNQWDVDTRTDIYSLGVLLYELLSGEVPFERQRLRRAAIDELMRIIRDEEPPLPSTRLSKSLALGQIAKNRSTEPIELGKVIRGELDWIVMKALDKDRTRRYETANGLRMDVQRYLEGDPVTAAPLSAIYRLKKLARRHRVAVGISVLVTSLLLMGSLGTTIGMFWALREKSRADGQTLVAKEAEARAENARETAEYSRYTSNIPVVSQLLLEDRRIQAKSILQSAPAVHRNWEWARLAEVAWRRGRIDRQTSRTTSSAAEFWGSLPPRAVDFLPWELPGGLHGGFFGPDSSSVYFYHARGEVRKFSVAYGDEQARYLSDGESAIALAISPTGSRLASFPFSNEAIVFDIDKGNVVGRGRDDLEISPPWTCCWSPDEAYLVTGHMDGTIRVWNAQSVTVDLLAEWPGHAKNTLDLYIPHSADSIWSASNDGTVRQWSLPDGQPIKTYQAPTDGEISYQTISPLGTYSAAVLADGSSFVWKIASEKNFSQLSGPTAKTYTGPQFPLCAFTPDESCVAVMTGEMGFTLYDVANSRVITDGIRHGDWAIGLEFSADGRMLLTTSEDGRAKIWSCLPEDKPDEFQAHGDAVYQIDTDESGRKLLTGSYDGTAAIWDLYDHRRLAEFNLHNAAIVAVDLHPDGRRAATLDAEGMMHVWDTATASKCFSIDPESDEFAGHISGAGGGLRSNVLNFSSVLSTGIFTPDGNRLVTYHHNLMKVFDVSTGKVVTPLEGANECGWPVYSHDSRSAAIIEMNAKSIGVWDLESGKLCRRFSQGSPLVMVHFSPIDNRLVTSSMNSEIFIWSTTDGSKLRLADPAGNVTSCNFSSDGRFVLAGYADSKVRIWDAKNGELITTLAGHSQRIRGAQLNPDATRVLTWGMDNQAMIWDLTRPLANQLLVLGDRDAKLVQTHWTPDGRDIVAAWSDGTIEVWRGATQEDLAELNTESDMEFDRAFDKWKAKYMNK